MVDSSGFSRSNFSELKPFSCSRRFETEYETLSKLGRGGFSSVYMVRNLLDNSLSAVKKIVIKINHQNKYNIQSEVKNALQEIRTLANIKSEYVVVYKHSWIEVKIKNDEEVQINKINEIPIYNDDEDSFELSYQANKTNDDVIEFLESSKKLSQHKYSSFQKNNVSLNPLPVQTANYSNKFVVGNIEYDIEKIENMIIYIQMELCKETLHDFIERRNSEVSGKIADFLVENELDILKIFLQICKGLDFIHSKEKLIHRDLKPKNIFFTEDSKIKLGDFGLATKSSLSSSLTASSPINLTPNPIDVNTKTSPTESCATRFTFDTSFTSEYHTKNIGTLLYAAPEQIKQNYYDQKADMYSLGLILFDLVYPIKTVMEKHKLFESLKKGLVPHVIKEKLPLVSKLLETLINDDPVLRPRAKEIVILLEEYIAQFEKLKEIKSSSPQKKRKRFFSEYIETVRPQKLLIKMDEGYGQCMWRTFWIKIINDKLLIFNCKDSMKASMSYDLKECDLKGKVVEENERKMIRINNYKSSFEIKFLEKKRTALKKRSLSLNSINVGKKKYESNELVRQLNYVIELEHPYMQKCYLKSVNLIESMEIYNLFSNIE